MRRLKILLLPLLIIGAIVAIFSVVRGVRNQVLHPISNSHAVVASQESRTIKPKSEAGVQAQKMPSWKLVGFGDFRGVSRIFITNGQSDLEFLLGQSLPDGRTFDGYYNGAVIIAGKTYQVGQSI